MISTAQKIKYFLFFLILWALGFLAWEWWNSYPKVKPVQLTAEKNLNGKIDSILYHAVHEYRLPGLSIALVQNGKVIYLNAFGFENLETKDSLTVESQIFVASVSKLFTALGVANIFQNVGVLPQDYVYTLELEGKVNLSSIANIRIQDLLSHQSSIRDKNISERIFSFSRDKTLNEWGGDFVDNVSHYQTDSYAYNYADSNFDLLGFLLSQSEELDFDSLIQRYVLIPSGMLNSRFVTTWPIEENKITGYQKTFLWKRLEPKRISFPILPSPSSGLLTTTKDMSLALIHLLRGEMGGYQKAFDWLTIEGSVVPLGFQKTLINGKEWIGHFGGQAGYSSLLFYSIEAETGIFLFTNSRDKTNFRIAIANQVISNISP